MQGEDEFVIDVRDLRGEALASQRSTSCMNRSSATTDSRWQAYQLWLWWPGASGTPIACGTSGYRL